MNNYFSRLSSRSGIKHNIPQTRSQADKNTGSTTHWSDLETHVETVSNPGPTMNADTDVNTGIGPVTETAKQVRQTVHPEPGTVTEPNEKPAQKNIAPANTNNQPGRRTNTKPDIHQGTTPGPRPAMQEEPVVKTTAHSQQTKTTTSIHKEQNKIPEKTGAVPVQETTAKPAAITPAPEKVSPRRAGKSKITKNENIIEKDSQPLTNLSRQDLSDKQNVIQKETTLTTTKLITQQDKTKTADTANRHHGLQNTQQLATATTGGLNIEQSNHEHTSISNTYNTRVIHKDAAFVPARTEAKNTNIHIGNVAIEIRQAATETIKTVAASQPRSSLSGNVTNKTARLSRYYLKGLL